MKNDFWGLIKPASKIFLEKSREDQSVYSRNYDSTFFSFSVNSYFEHEEENINSASPFIILGKVYYKNSSSEVSKTDIREVIRKDPDSFPLLFWGDYIIFLVINAELHVYRSPTGKISFFYAEGEEEPLLWGTEIKYVINQWGKPKRYNADYLISFLLEGNITAEQTAFEKISELEQGCKLVISSNLEVKKEIFWDPLQKTIDLNSEEFSKLFLSLLSNVILNLGLYQITQ